jgi:hypothetical protein
MVNLSGHLSSAASYRLNSAPGRAVAYRFGDDFHSGFAAMQHGFAVPPPPFSRGFRISSPNCPDLWRVQKRALKWHKEHEILPLNMPPGWPVYG